jgi:hypothetical protein
VTDDDVRVRADERRRLLAEFELERNQLIRNIETCRLRDITGPFIGAWSILDIIEHVASGEEEAAASLRAFRGGAAQTAPEFACDAAPVVAERNLSQLWPALERLRQTREGILAAMGEFSDDELTAEGSFPPALVTACKDHDKLHWHEIAAKLAGMAGVRRNVENLTNDS